MQEQRTEVRVVRVDYFCEECGGLMKPTGFVLTSSPPQYPHTCSYGHTADLRRSYPAIEYEELGT